MGDIYRSYSEEDRAQALATLVACGGNMSETSRLTGVPWSTLDAWNRGRKVNENVKEKAGEYELRFAAIAEKVAERLLAYLDDPDKMSEATLPQLSTAFGTVVDKVMVLKGAAGVLKLAAVEENLLARANGSDGVDTGDETATEAEGDGIP